jgi:hypothetical protein
MKKAKGQKPKTLEQWFPDPKGRAAGDAAVDALDVKTSIAQALDVWEAAYYARTGTSPFRKPESK